jgi:hypothetical protein
MEADIKLCEDLLAMDNFNVKGETRERPDRETPGRRPTPPERGSSPERKGKLVQALFTKRRSLP